MNKVFDALASDARRQMLAYLAHDDLTAGEIASRFAMSKPAISKHLQILENAGLVASEKRGQFVWYSLERESLTGAIAQFLQMVAPERAASAVGEIPPAPAAKGRPKDRDANLRP